MGRSGRTPPSLKIRDFFGKKCYRKRRFIARNPHRQRSLGACIIVSDKKRSKHNSEPLNPASPAKTSRLPSHSTMTIVENSICVCFITWNHQIFIKAFLLLYEFKKTVKLYGGGGTSAASSLVLNIRRSNFADIINQHPPPPSFQFQASHLTSVVFFNTV